MMGNNRVLVVLMCLFMGVSIVVIKMQFFDREVQAGENTELLAKLDKIQQQLDAADKYSKEGFANLKEELNQRIEVLKKENTFDTLTESMLKVSARLDESEKNSKDGLANIKEEINQHIDALKLDNSNTVDKMSDKIKMLADNMLNVGGSVDVDSAKAKRNWCVDTLEVPVKQPEENFPSDAKFDGGPIQKAINDNLKDKKGFEIGGPSNWIFSDHYQIYGMIASLDNTNYGAKTIWTNEVKDGSPFHYKDGKADGIQYVRDATDLHGIEDEKYDFVLASHALEHIANPLKAVSEWTRVLKTGGFMMLILPDPKHTFDDRRKYVPFEHFLESWQNNTLEDDLSHLKEIVELHDIPKDGGVHSKEEFENRSKDNFKNRALHQHIFSFSLLTQIYECFNIKPLAYDWWAPYSMTIFGQKQ